MASPVHLIVCRLDDQRIALPLPVVVRTVRVAEWTPLPEAPHVVLGLINVQGALLPVLSLRRRCQLPDRDVELTDQLVIAQTPTRRVALLVDAVEVIQCDASSLVPVQSLVPGTLGVHDVIKLGETIILLYDPMALLRVHEEEALNLAMPTPPGDRVLAEGAACPAN